MNEQNWEHFVLRFVTAKRNRILCSVVLFSSFCHEVILYPSLNHKNLDVGIPNPKLKYFSSKGTENKQWNAPFHSWGGGGGLLEPGTECSVREFPVLDVKMSILCGIQYGLGGKAVPS